MKKGVSSLRLKKLGLALIVFLTLLVSILIWANHSGSLMLNGRLPVILRSLSNLMALLAAYAILLQILMIGRIKWIESVFGLDKLSRWHRINGFVIPFLILVHPILLIVSSSLVSGRDWLTSFLRLVRIEDVLNATIGAGLFLVLVLISVLIVYKKLKYETWYLTHLVMYAAVLLAFGHQLAGDDLGGFWPMTFWYAMYVFVLVNLIYFRFFLPIWKTLKHEFKVARVVKETGDVYSIYISGKDLDKFKVKAGQFFIFRFLDRKRWWQAHPFSLSCLPNGQFLRISVKASGDFTSALDKVKLGTKVYIDGPHGVFTADRSTKDKYLLIAGGIGITPIRSLAEKLCSEQKDSVLLYACRNSENIVFKEELNHLPSTKFKVYCVLSGDAGWQGEKDYIDQEKIQRLAPDFMDREVYLCGPKPMMAQVRSVLKKLGVPKHQIHFEQFSM